MRLSLYQEGEGPHNFYFPLIALSWPQLFCILWVSNISHQRASVFSLFSIIPLLDRWMQPLWFSARKSFWLDRSACRLWGRINDAETVEARPGQRLRHRSPSATAKPWRKKCGSTLTALKFTCPKMGERASLTPPCTHRLQLAVESSCHSNVSVSEGPVCASFLHRHPSDSALDHTFLYLHLTRWRMNPI